MGRGAVPCESLDSKPRLRIVINFFRSRRRENDEPTVRKISLYEDGDRDELVCVMKRTECEEDFLCHVHVMN